MNDSRVKRRLYDSRLALWAGRSWVIYTKIDEIGTRYRETFNIQRDIHYLVLLSFKFGFSPNFWCKRFPCVMPVMKYSVISLIWLSDGNNVRLTMTITSSHSPTCLLLLNEIVKIGKFKQKLLFKRIFGCQAKLINYAMNSSDNNVLSKKGDWTPIFSLNFACYRFYPYFWPIFSQ